MDILNNEYNSEIDRLLTFLHDTKDLLQLGDKERYYRLDFTGGKYYISNRSNVLSLCRRGARVLCPYVGTDGYEYVDLYHHGISDRWRLNRLVAYAFCMDSELLEIGFDKLLAHHIDGDKLNNDVSNIILLTPKEHSKAHKILRELLLDG